jgi:hypothetical protein
MSKRYGWRIGAVVALVMLGVSLPSGPPLVVGAPLAQATATDTPTPTNTPTPTPTSTPTTTPGPAFVMLGGVPLVAARATPSGYLLGVDCPACRGSYTTPVTYAATAVVTPGTTPVVAANPARKYLICGNDSDAAIYLNFAASQPVSTGLRVNANGGSYEMRAEAQNVYTGAIYAVATATGKTLLCVEGQ